MEVHSPDFYGTVALAGDPGIAGQHLQSAGPGVQAVWATVPTSAGLFKFTSPSALTHTIVHNLNNIAPNVTVYLSSDGRQVQPTYIDAIDANTLEINFFVARAIQGTVTG